MLAVHGNKLRGLLKSRKFMYVMLPLTVFYCPAHEHYVNYSLCFIVPPHRLSRNFSLAKCLCHQLALHFPPLSVHVLEFLWCRRAIALLPLLWESVLALSRPFSGFVFFLLFFYFGFFFSSSSFFFLFALGFLFFYHLVLPLLSFVRTQTALTCFDVLVWGIPVGCVRTRVRMDIGDEDVSWQNIM